MTTLFDVRGLPFAGITLPRARLRGLVAVFLLSLTGCGSTIVTRIHSRDVLARYHISQSERRALRVDRRAGLGPPRLRSP
ncbi:MAG TPA: hypothetical protein VIT23_07480, partial [Terrimicrobiaceae bacterium]